MLFDYTFAVVVLGVMLIGVIAGALGSFAVLRKQSLLGDAISHAALPGVAVAFLLTVSKNPFVLLLGATCSGLIGALCMIVITRHSRISQDAALGIVLSVFFGIGVVLLTYIQKLPTATKAGLNTYLFGNASTMLKGDVQALALVGLFALLLVMLFWKEFILITFDRDFAHTLGFPVMALDIMLMSCLVVSIALGLQSVGVVLMSAIIIAPAVAARQWTHSFGIMVILASVFGAVSSFFGVLISSQFSNVPTGPVIVVVLSLVVFLSLFFSPKRGMVAEWLQHKKNRKRMDVLAILSTLYDLSKSHDDDFYPHPLHSIKAVHASATVEGLRQIEALGLISCHEMRWRLTKKGKDYLQKGDAL